MSKPLDFNNLKKRYLTVTLADEKNTTLLLRVPTKAILDEFIAVQSTLDAIGEDNTDPALIDDLYRVCARVLSSNKTGAKITQEYLEEIFDFDDIMIFLDAYTEFIGEIVNSKN